MASAGPSPGRAEWRPTQEQQVFIKKYAEAIEHGNAALFAGAGLSRSAGFVDWKNLLRGIAEDLGLDIEKEPDLVAVAQYHQNARNTRADLNDLILDEFQQKAERSRNHYLLSRLPIDTVWTTNYDELLEKAFEEAGKSVDLKVTEPNLAQSRKGRDVTVYKMHGTVTNPNEAVLTKDDYEKYERSHPLFSESLRGDLISKTFLFLGFSFNDPNVDYLLSRVRVLLDKNQRTHYAIVRRPSPNEDDYEYLTRRLELRMADLKRFAIQTVLIDQYWEIEKLLELVSLYAHRKNVLISGSAREYQAMRQEDLEKLTRTLGRRLIEEDFNLVSGMGVGIGEYCVIEALKALHNVKKGRDSDRVIIRPFPRSEGSDQKVQNERHREDLISRSGCVVFLAGNRGAEYSEGVREEFKIAKHLKRAIIPVAATGYVAEEIWKEVFADQNKFFPGIDATAHLQALADRNRSPEELAKTVLELVRLTSAADRVQKRTL